jgi:hypothetical protein
VTPENMIDAPYPPTRFDRCAMAIYQHEATQPFPSFANWRHAGWPGTRCGMMDHITHESGAKMGMTSSNPPRSRAAQTYSSPAKFAATPLRGGSRAENTTLSGEARMDAYIYRAALWCGPCIIKALVAERKAAPGAIDTSPAEALQQIVSANGFTSESHYDSDDLPKRPHAEGGGEADAPQHCDGCGQFLRNPLTVDGLICVENMICNYLTTKEAATDAVIEWADFYKDELDFRRIVLEALKG